MSQKGPDLSLPSFESQLPVWAEKCLAFQISGKTWLPTKPCCPASLFVGLGRAPWPESEEVHPKPCAQRLGKAQLREFRAFFREQPHHALFKSTTSPQEKASRPKPLSSKPPLGRPAGGSRWECYKMWPWMRDLPTRLWMGNGWIMEEDGMRKLEPSEPGGAMPGVQIFESVGTAVDESQQDGSEVLAAEPGQATSKFRGLERQSGVSHISWDPPHLRWRIQWWEARKRKQAFFPIKLFHEQGLSENEAVEAALREAKAHREELVRKGVLKPPKAVKPEQGKHSTVKGVYYYKPNQQWRAKLVDPSTKKVVHGGRFANQEEAESKARELAKELGIKDIENRVVPVKHLSELKHFEPLGPQPGVRWSLGEQCWHACCAVKGRTRHLRCRPKDFSEKEVEKAWKQAVAWRKQQEKERDQAKKR